MEKEEYIKMKKEEYKRVEKEMADTLMPLFENNKNLLKNVADLLKVCEDKKKELGFNPCCNNERKCPFTIAWDFENVCALHAIRIILERQEKTKS